MIHQKGHRQYAGDYDYRYRKAKGNVEKVATWKYQGAYSQAIRNVLHKKMLIVRSEPIMIDVGDKKSTYHGLEPEGRG